MFFGRSKYFMGTAGDCDVPNSLDPVGRGTSIRVTIEIITGRITGCTAERRPMGSRGTLRCKLCLPEFGLNGFVYTQPASKARDI